MKYFIIALLSPALCLTSCSSNDDNGDRNELNSKFSKNIDLDLNPCDYISREMILSHIDVAREDLELKDESKKASSAYAQCGYKWKKANYEEIQKKRTDMMMAYAMKGIKKDGKEEVKLSDLTQLESPNSYIYIGHFGKYDNIKSAGINFKNSHSVPSEGDMKKLHEEIDKQELDKNAKKMGKSLTDGIGSSLKFTEIKGIGDQAYYDHLDRSLDVRYGTFYFSVFIDTELDFENNMEIAKEVANDVWKSL